MWAAMLRAVTPLLFLLAACAGADDGDGMYKGYETPDWTVEARDGAFEVRDVAPYLAAEVTYPGDPDRALRRGFRTLAGYIFGKNDGGAKVAMTAPVVREPAKLAMTAPVTREADAGGWTVSFMMPKDRRRDTLPAPDDPAIRIVEVDPGRRAVLSFSGWATEGRIARQAAELDRLAAARGLRLQGPLAVAWFDDPFTLPWRRRNEVSRRIADRG